MRLSHSIYKKYARLGAAMFFAFAMVMPSAIVNAAPTSTDLPSFNKIIGYHNSSLLDGKFYNPAGIATDANDNIYVVDSYNSRIQKFDANGNFLSKWGTYGTGNGQLMFPHGIAIDAAGNIYVADTHNHRVQKFDPNGSFIAKWGGTYSEEPGQFAGPEGIAIDKNSGDIYVVETNNHRIQRFDSNFNFIIKWGGNGVERGHFISPVGAGVDPGGNVYVTEGGYNRIQKFTPTGEYISQLGGTDGNSTGQFQSPGDITFDASGKTYVADTNNHRIQVLTSNGTFITQWGSRGTADNQFTYLEASL